MNDITFNYITILTLFCCLVIVFSGFSTKLLCLSFASLFGTYVVGGGALNVLPGPLVCAFLVGGILISIMLRLKINIKKIPYGNVIICFLVYAIIVTLVMPNLFSNAIQVIRPGYIAEDGIRGTNSLSWTTSNIAQITYFVFDILIVYSLVSYRMINGNAIQSRVISFNIVIAFTLSVLVMIEFSLCMSGLNVDLFGWFMGDGFLDPRPDRYALVNALGLPIRRAQAIMGEPSFYSTYMAGIYAVLLYQLRVKPSVRCGIFFILVLSSLILAFSTTAIFSVFVISVGVLCAPTGFALAKQNSKWANKFFLLLIGLILLCLILYAIFSSEVIFDYIFGKLSNTDGYEEGNYSSGAERLYWDITALGALINSYGIGIGAGSTRASSFFINFIAAFGVVGLVIFLMVGYKFIASVYSAKSSIDYMTRSSRILCLGWLVGFIISVPDAFSFFYFWIGIGITMPLVTFNSEKRFSLHGISND
ncbi:hypothetical protein ACK35P_08185 [Aeromonas veronii]